jgi:hypothetical protein
MKKQFSDLMIEKYPDLFPKDKEGNPTYPSCGFYCPKGWENIVETALFYMDSRVKNPENKQTWVAWYWLSTRLYRWTLQPIYNKLYRMTSPTEKFHWVDGKRNSCIALRQEQVKAAEEAAPTKTKLHKKLIAIRRAIEPKWRFKKVYCRPVQIDQIKEKFGTLRLYTSGGDAKTSAIVGFAEAMSAKVCEETGAPGKGVSRGGWWRTLSPSQAKKLGYK